jgi:hypothetical protein
VQRFVIFLVLTGGFSVLCSALVGKGVDALSGVAPAATPFLEEARRYGWLLGAVLGILFASAVI